MLQKCCPEPTRLDLLNALMGLDYLENFSLVGGINQALCFCHRLSVNMDRAEKLESTFENICDAKVAMVKGSTGYYRIT